MWDSILNEFILGWPEEDHDHPSANEKNMILKFLNSSRYEELMKVYLEEQITNRTLRTDTINGKNKAVIY